MVPRTDDDRRGRRAYLAGVAALYGGLAGCVGASGASGTGATPFAPADGDRPPCAEGVRITELDARIGVGSVPEVRLRIENAGDRPVAYEMVVIFRQGTSLGIPARTGRDVLSGTLDPGGTVEATATDDAADVRNTEEYVLDASFSCPSG